MASLALTFLPRIWSAISRLRARFSWPAGSSSDVALSTRRRLVHGRWATFMWQCQRQTYRRFRRKDFGPTRKTWCNVRKSWVEAIGDVEVRRYERNSAKQQQFGPQASWITCTPCAFPVSAGQKNLTVVAAKNPTSLASWQIYEAGYPIMLLRLVDGHQDFYFTIARYHVEADTNGFQYCSCLECPRGHLSTLWLPQVRELLLCIPQQQPVGLTWFLSSSTKCQIARGTVYVFTSRRYPCYRQGSPFRLRSVCSSTTKSQGYVQRQSTEKEGGSRGVENEKSKRVILFVTGWWRRRRWGSTRSEATEEAEEEREKAS